MYSVNLSFLYRQSVQVVQVAMDLFPGKIQGIVNRNN